jgi:hypothetical protein
MISSRNELLHLWLTEFPAQGINLAQEGRRHLHPAPRLGRGEQGGVQEGQTALLGREAGDDPRPSLPLPEEPLQAVRGPDPLNQLRPRGRE